MDALPRELANPADAGGAGIDSSRGTDLHIANKAAEVRVNELQGAAQPFILDEAKPLDPESFPNQPRNGSTYVPTTIPNVKHLLLAYGITARYNTITKKVSITMPGQSGAEDNADNVALSQIISLATLNGMSAGQVPSYVYNIADRNLYNPIAVWITSKPWDGKDRREEFYATLVEHDDYPKPLKHTLMYRWLLSAVAAAFKPNGFRARGVLTIQGPQSIGKTAWVSAIVPDPGLREHTIKLDHHIDASSKDSQLTAIGHWIVEIGELDSSFKKDVARLKGFLTSDRDKVRRPYARVDSEYPRRTVFCATVNDPNFLVDATGNSRWWTIPVTKINYQHGIDMQQLFAQLEVDYRNGVQWWLTDKEEASLEENNKAHRSISAIRERVLAAMDLDRLGQSNLPAITPIELLIEIGIKSPGNTQCKECAAVLREYVGESKRIQGQNKWRVPLRRNYADSYTPRVPVRPDDDRF